MGRDQGFTAWELEAERRREVIATDHGLDQRTGRARPPEARDLERGGIRVPSWLATFGRAVGSSSWDAAPPRSECQPHVQAVRPGS